MKSLLWIVSGLVLIVVAFIAWQLFAPQPKPPVPAPAFTR